MNGITAVCLFSFIGLNKIYAFIFFHSILVDRACGDLP